MATSNKAVYTAIAANMIVAAAKFAVAAITASASMFAEGVHSLVDAGNDGLLIVGNRARGRPPDDTHPFGYGKEQYFWTLIVAMGIFALGGGISAYEGLSRLIAPQPIESSGWTYVVLAIAFLSDGYSWVVAFRQLRASRDEANIFKAAQASKDASTFTVWFEDSAATIGVAIAFVGVLLSSLLESPYPDGIASLLIALTMAITAGILAYECKKLLIGESADTGMVEGIREIVEGDDAVTLCGPPLTMQLGPEDVLLNLDVQFRDDLPASEMIEAVDRLERAIRSRYKEVRRIFIEAERLRPAPGRAEAEPEPSCPAGRTPADY